MPRARKPGATEKTIPKEFISERDIAERYAAARGGQLLFDHDRGQWFEWTGVYWKEDDNGLVREEIAAQARAETIMAVEGTKRKARSKAFAGGAEKLARDMRVFATNTRHWNPDPFLLGTPDGTVDLKTGAMRPANPDDRINRLTLVGPSDDEDCPLWKEVLHEMLGANTEVIEFLQRWCGYSLTGKANEEQLVFLYGPGGNGKGTFISTVTDIMADYHVTASMHAFITEGTQTHLTHVAVLAGARCVTAQETKEGSSWDEGRLKNLTGGDKIRANFMRQNTFEFRPQFSLMISGNFMPKIETVDEAIRRRINVVLFVVKPAAPDNHLKDKLMAEAPGILRWMINGAVMWAKGGLRQPDAVKQATEEYFEGQQPFEHWVDEMCELGQGLEDTTRNLYEGYCEEVLGTKPMSKIDFSRRLTKLGEQRGEPGKPAFWPGKVQRQRGFKGIKGPEKTFL